MTGAGAATAFLSPYDLAAVIMLLLFGLLIVIFVGRLTFTLRGVKVTAERTERNTAAVGAAVGPLNGGGDVTSMLVQGLEELGELRAGATELATQVREMNIRLEERTSIVRQGGREAEPLGEYTQDRLHDVLGVLGALKLQADTLWRFLKDDYDLPDLPSIREPHE